MSNPTSTYEIVVVGAGPGGYAAAFMAADLGKKTALVDASKQPGGVCLQRGCIPSKALLHFAKIIREARDAAEHGLVFGEPTLDLDKIRAFKNKVIGNLCGGLEGLCKSRGIDYINARASFENSTQLSLDNGTTLGFSHAIVATGSRPVIPKAFDLGDPRIMDSTAALELADIPGNLLIVGGGYIGLEMGTVYSALGSKVTVVEMLDGILMGADRDLVVPLKKRLDKEFEAILVKTKVAKMEPRPEGIAVTLENEEGSKTLLFDKVLISTGRRPNHESIGLEKTRVVVTPKGFIEVDNKGRTSDPNILAIGDIAGEPMLAHKASREARVAVEALCGHPAEFDNLCIPAVVFTDPEVAWCGITETQALAEKRDVQVIKFPWAASGRAQSLGRTDGLTKVIYETGTERILGVGIVGDTAGEMIAEGALAIENALVAGDIGGTIHAHPTLSETFMETAEMLHGNATHIFRKKKA